MSFSTEKEKTKTKAMSRRHIFHEAEIPRPKNHDIEVPRPKNLDTEIRHLD